MLKKEKKEAKLPKDEASSDKGEEQKEMQTGINRCPINHFLRIERYYFVALP